MKFNLFTFISIFFILSLNAQNWNKPITIIDSSVVSKGNFGPFSKLLVVKGKPAMVVPEKNLVYLRAMDSIGQSWLEPVIVDYQDGVGVPISFQIIRGRPAISYYDNNYDALKYVYARDSEGIEWSDPVYILGPLNRHQGRTHSLYEINGLPALAYRDDHNGDLNFIRANDPDGNTWGSPKILDQEGNVGYQPSLQVIKGSPVIAYSDFTRNEIKFIRAKDPNGDSWEGPTTIVTENGGFEQISLEIVNGHPAVAYFAGFFLQLKYVRALDSMGGSWQTPILIDALDPGELNDLTVIEGRPAIAYLTFSLEDTHDEGDIKYVIALDSNGMVWPSPVYVDTSGRNILTISLEPVKNHPTILYFDLTDLDQKFNRALDPLGTSWGKPVSIGTLGVYGLFNSLHVINGHPAISYFSEGDFDLRFVRSLDMFGNTWDKPISADTSKWGGTYSKLLQVNGKPAIAYKSGGQGFLNYTQAADASGTVWPQAEIKLDQFHGDDIAFIIVNGNPAIIYPDALKGNLKLMRALDAEGNTWGQPVSITSEQAYHPSAMIINSRLGVSYVSKYNGTLRFILSLDINGSSWGESILLDEFMGPFNSLSSINGFPAVAYLGRNLDLNLIIALNYEGTKWKQPILLDTAGMTGWYCNMLSFSNLPVISYYDYTKGDLKFISALNVSGTSWSVPIILDSLGNVGQYLSMEFFNQVIGISYYDFTKGTLKYIHNNALSIQSSFDFEKICSGSDQEIQYTGNETVFNPGNVFTVQLSDSMGNFNEPFQILASDTTNSTHGIIRFNIPLETANGNYKIRVNSSNPFIKGQSAGPFTIIPSPEAPIISQNGNQLVSSAMSGNQWYLNQVEIAGATTQYFTPTESGMYSARATLLNCKSPFSSSINIVVTSTSPDAFDDKILVYPNPVINELFITNLPPKSRVLIFDLLGRQLKFRQSKMQAAINLTQYDAGTYLLFIEDSSNKCLVRKKIIKQ